MRVLFVGNSFTYFNDLPRMVSCLLRCETKGVTRGSAYLRYFLDPADELSARLEEALKEGGWDYLVIQDMSFHPVADREAFFRDAAALCARAKAEGITPVFYSTWAYEEGSEKLNQKGCSYDQMDAALQSAYREAAAANGALLAPVGAAFTRARTEFPLYQPDHFHPSPFGTYLAAWVFAYVLTKGQADSSWRPEGIGEDEAKMIRKIAKEMEENHS